MVVCTVCGFASSALGSLPEAGTPSQQLYRDSDEEPAGGPQGPAPQCFELSVMRAPIRPTSSSSEQPRPSFAHPKLPQPAKIACQPLTCAGEGPEEEDEEEEEEEEEEEMSNDEPSETEMYERPCQVCKHWHHAVVKI